MAYRLIDKNTTLILKPINVSNIPEEIIPENWEYLEVPVELEGKYLSLQYNAETETYYFVEDVSTRKAKEITDAYNTMNNEVYAQMYLIYGTTNADSAVAYNETFKLMKDYPALFAVKNLKASKAVGTFSIGDVLDTDQKVIDYATAYLTLITNYAVWRMERIDQFKAQREQILNA